MRSRYSSIHAPTVRATDSGFLASCACGWAETRHYRETADLVAREHQRGERKWRA